MAEINFVRESERERGGGEGEENEGTHKKERGRNQVNYKTWGNPRRLLALVQIIRECKQSSKCIYP